MQSERWNWLDEGVVPLLLATMRAAWLWPWLALVHAWFAPSQPAPVLPLWALIGIPVLSSILTRRVLPPLGPDHREPPHRGIQIGIAATGILALVLVVWIHFYANRYPLWDTTWLLTAGRHLIYWGAELPVEAMTLVTGVVLWLRGVLDARTVRHHEDIWGTFVIGSILLALYLWIGQIDDRSLADATGWIFAFFASGMAALAITNLKTASGWSLFGRNAGRVQANRYWLLSILATIVGLLLLGLFIGWLLSPEDVVWVLDGIKLVFSLIGQVLYLIIMVVSYVLFMAAYFIYWLIQPLLAWLRGEETAEPELQLPQAMATDEPFPQVTEAAASVPEPFRWMALVVIMLVVFVVFMLVLRRLRAAGEEEAEEIRESIYSSDLLQDQLAALWDRLQGRFQRGPSGPSFADLSGEPDSRRAIRALYQQVLTLADQRGAARPPQQTPHEYRPLLQKALVSSEASLATITDGYIQARYGDVPPPPEVVQRVRAAWAEVEAGVERRAEGSGTQGS